MSSTHSPPAGPTRCCDAESRRVIGASDMKVDAILPTQPPRSLIQTSTTRPCHSRIVHVAARAHCRGRVYSGNQGEWSPRAHVGSDRRTFDKVPPVSPVTPLGLVIMATDRFAGLVAGRPYTRAAGTSTRHKRRHRRAPTRPSTRLTRHAVRFTGGRVCDIVPGRSCCWYQPRCSGYCLRPHRSMCSIFT